MPIVRPSDSYPAQRASQDADDIGELVAGSM